VAEETVAEVEEASVEVTVSVMVAETVELATIVEVAIEVTVPLDALLISMEVAVCVCDVGNIWAVASPSAPATTTASTMPVSRRPLNIMGPYSLGVPLL
jgi:hypothetical protein